MGIYFLEPGANQRPSKVTYDRDNTSIALAKPGDIDWDHAFNGATWFHITGITPAHLAKRGRLVDRVSQEGTREGTHRFL